MGLRWDGRSGQNLAQGEVFHVSDVLHQNIVLAWGLTLIAAACLDSVYSGEDFFRALGAEGCPQELDEGVREENQAMTSI